MWVIFVAVFAAILVFGTRASSLPAAIFMAFAGFAAYLFDSVIFIPLAIAGAAAGAWLARGHTDQPMPGQRALREALICSTVFVLYEIGRHLVEGSWDAARSNAEAIMRFQDRLALGQEVAVQTFLLRNDSFVGFINSSYSWFFLPVVAGALFWLFVADDDVYRRFRTSLAISAALGVLVMWVFPVAPPRLTPGNELIGTHAMRGGSHSFVNQFAAVPSFHVGWVALSGLALFVAVRHWLRWFWLIGPVFFMGFIVMATGHHYFVDGIIGTALGAVPFLALTYLAAIERVPERRLSFADTGFAKALNTVAKEISTVPRLRFSIYSLTLLLTYMIVRQFVDPGFTNYWGYIVAQIAITIIIIMIMSVKLAPEGGLSLVTHSIVVFTTYADTFGTAGHMYDQFAWYDKFTHFLGTAAIATAAGDVLLALVRRGTISWKPVSIMIVAIVIAMSGGLAWEVYEFYGDRLFGTGRHAGTADTIYDIISDFVGAVVAASLLYWWHFSPRQATTADRSGYLVAESSSDVDVSD